MEERPAPPRMLRITTAIILVGILGTLLWLIIAPPAVYAHYHSWFQAASDLLMGIIFTCCGLFYHSWFATIMGVHKAPIILHFGPERARLYYTVIGLVFLTLAGVGFLLLVW